MRIKITAVLLFISAIAVADDRTLVGKWESVARNENGIGSTLQLNADGSLARTLGAMLDYHYTFDGRKLRTTATDPNTGQLTTTTLRVKIAGDTLIEKDAGANGVDVQMTRQTPMDLARPLLGTWRYPHYSGSTAFVTFTDDGHELVRIPLKVEGGSWVAVGSQLTLNVEGNDPVTSTYRVNRDVLTLSDNGKDFKYRRARY